MKKFSVVILLALVGLSSNAFSCQQQDCMGGRLTSAEIVCSDVTTISETDVLLFSVLGPNFSKDVALMKAFQSDFCNTGDVTVRDQEANVNPNKLANELIGRLVTLDASNEGIYEYTDAERLLRGKLYRLSRTFPSY
ncbi:MAG: hypothetical protein COT74_09280 [Bdellovibrionales bacterium CG10_big_fil_rev_8_21_14_0_10_45_34]|nr:MAG: hypothetical protein COT74_09280 [Bdellovibrionales bacterium CG10_big_fil_rev_8_21_14_0_10_45_34]